MTKPLWNIILNYIPSKTTPKHRKTTAIETKIGNSNLGKIKENVLSEKPSKTCEKIIREISTFERSELRFDEEGNLAGSFNPKKKPVTRILLKKLSPYFYLSKKNFKNISSPAIYGHCEDLINSLPQSVSNELEMSNFLPPPHIHMMGRKKGSMFDIKNCDVIVNALKDANRSIAKHKHYLDFGCSSGRTVRTLGAAYPRAFWHGVDPVEESILFARMAFPRYNFYVSEQEPPCQFSSNSFDGVVALSIWSHFSEEMGKAWFQEMHRIIRQDGFLLLTTHGYTDIARKAQIQRFEDSEMKLIFENIKNIGFHFIGNIKEGHRNLITSDWGTTFFTKEWLISNVLGEQWELLHYAPGEWGARQDVYVLTPKKES